MPTSSSTDVSLVPPARIVLIERDRTGPFGDGRRGRGLEEGRNTGATPAERRSSESGTSVVEDVVRSIEARVIDVAVVLT